MRCKNCGKIVNVGRERSRLPKEKRGRSPILCPYCRTKLRER